MVEVAMVTAGTLKMSSQSATTYIPNIQFL